MEKREPKTAEKMGEEEKKKDKVHDSASKKMLATLLKQPVHQKMEKKQVMDELFHSDSSSEERFKKVEKKGK